MSTGNGCAAGRIRRPSVVIRPIRRTIGTVRGLHTVGYRGAVRAGRGLHIRCRMGRRAADAACTVLVVRGIAIRSPGRKA